MARPELTIYHDAEELAAAAAEQISRFAAESIAARGRFTLCLTGGHTPRRTYELLARERGAFDRRPFLETAVHEEGGEILPDTVPLAEPVDIWPHTFLFFGDERFVPADDTRSNYNMVRQSLLRNAPLAADHVFPMPTDLAGAEYAAAAYARTLKTFFGDVAWPEFDLVLLGLGDDGHVAWLFPGAPSLAEHDRWVTSSPSGTLPPAVDRVTLTFPALNAARRVMFLVSGANKAPAVADVLQGRASVQQRPAAGIRPTSGHVVWLIDRTAATALGPAKE